MCVCVYFIYNVVILLITTALKDPAEVVAVGIKSYMFSSKSYNFDSVRITEHIHIGVPEESFTNVHLR